MNSTMRRFLIWRTIVLVLDELDEHFESDNSGMFDPLEVDEEM